MTQHSTFEVDKKGLAKLLSARGKEFIISELLQNAWDEDVTEVGISFVQEDGRAWLEVWDDSPEGFQDLAHAYTLFAESKKKGDAEKRGRFNLGEKLVIAIADELEIYTTKGYVRFDKDGRTMGLGKRDRGTLVKVHLKMNRQEADALRELVSMMIPPHNIKTTFNGERLMPRDLKASIAKCTLPTIVADDEGYMRPTARQTRVNIYEPLEGEKAMLYEMGIPVCETGDTYHVDIQQKVPLNMDRDNVTPAYLQKVRTAVLNEMAERMAPEEATAPWVAHALEDKMAEPEAVKAIVTARFGEKVVISDPSDPEGTKMATAAGYTVLAPRTFTREAWVNVKAAGYLPAGQVTPSPKVYEAGGRAENVVQRENWTQGMYDTERFVEKLCRILTGRNIGIKVVKEPQVSWVANFGPSSPCVTFNLSKLGHNFFGQVGSEAQVELLLHEFAHDRVSDHLSHQFADEVARLGAKLAIHINNRRHNEQGHGAMVRLDLEDL